MGGIFVGCGFSRDMLLERLGALAHEHHQIETQHLDPLAMLKYLMAENGMRPADLGRVLGNRGLASLILHGRRRLSKTHIRKLAEHFKVSPGLFLNAE